MADKLGIQSVKDQAHKAAEAIRNTQRAEDEVRTGDGNTVKVGSSKSQFEFNSGSKDYIFWAWKGGYLNLGARAEMGIYTRMEVLGAQTDHWFVDQSLAMPMTLKLDYNGKQIIAYDPKKDNQKAKRR
ncbi:hypothetical protein [Alkaliphilus crotonatoxidans]